MGLLSTLGAASARAYGFTRSAIAAAVDAYFNRVTLLLPGNGTNGAQNNTFLDSSTNNFTITRNGNTTQGTFSPFSQTGWSNYFSGTSYFTIPSAAYTSFSNSADWTIEFWFNTTVASATFFSNYVNTSPYAGAIISLITGGQLDIWEGGTHRTSAITGLNDGKWHHVAWVNSSGTSRVYVDGTLTNTNGAASFTTPASITRQTAWYVGYQDGSVYLTGYISNLRVVKGAAVYTSNFTPSTTSLGTTSGGQNPPTGTQTVFLTCQNNRFVDNSSNAATITITGSTSVQAFSPFAPSSAYSASTNGGSGYFDGSGDYLTLPSSSNLAVGTGDFCIEAWVYWTGSPASDILISNISSNDTQLAFRIDASNYPKLQGNNTNFVTSNTTVIQNQWYHLVCCRVSNSTSIFMNGTRTANASVTNDFSSTNAFSVGGTSGGDQLTGYMGALRLIKGSSPYDPTQTSITVPTAPPTAVTNTQLLCNFTNGGIFDATGKNVLETVGNAQISTTQSKFGGSSIAFDGTGDGLQIPDTEMLEFGSGNFTVEGWVRFAVLPATSGFAAIVGKWDASTQKSWYMYVYNNAGTYQLYFSYTTNGSTSINPVATISVTTNTWYHIAACRDGANLRLFVDGTQVGTTYNMATDIIHGGTYPVQVGRVAGTHDLNGFIDDLRITKGYARYTANFTAPTQAFALQ